VAGGGTLTGMEQTMQPPLHPVGRTRADNGEDTVTRCTAQAWALRLLVMGFLGAVLAAFLTPPLNVLDGRAHWERTYQVSLLQLVPERYSRNGYGGALPPDALKLAELAEQSFTSGEAMKGEDLRRWAYALLTAPDQTPRDTVFSNIAVHPPLAYLPGGMGIALVRAFGFDVLDQYFAACIANAAAFFALMALAVVLAPAAKLVFAIIAVAPSMMMQAGSISGDPLNLAVPAVFVALVWRLAVREGVMDRAELAGLAAAIVGLALLKAPAILFGAAGLIIPAARYASTGWPGWARLPSWRGTPLVQAAAGLLLAGLPGLLAWLLWHPQHPFWPGGYFGWPSDPPGVVALILAQPLEAVAFLFRQSFDAVGMDFIHSLTFAGGHGGPYHRAAPLVAGLLLFLAMAAAITGQPGGRARPVMALWLIGIGLAYTLAVHGAFWVGMTAPGDVEIRGVQPRYFLPVWLFHAAGLALLLPRRLLPEGAAVPIALAAGAVALGAFALPLLHFARYWVW